MKVHEILFEGPEERIVFIIKNRGADLLRAAAKDHSMPPPNLKGNAKDIVSTVLAEFDPSPNKQALQWIANRYADGAFKAEDKDKIKDSLKLFFKVSGKLQNKDLMSYKTLASFYDALKPYEGAGAVPVSGKQQQKAAKLAAEKPIDTPDFKVIVPKTEAASQFYGAGPKWCTAAEKNCMFDEYNRKGPLYIIIAGAGAAAKKYQLHYETNSFMDDRDLPVSPSDIKYLSTFPEYKDFLNMLIEKHYGKFIAAK